MYLAVLAIIMSIYGTQLTASDWPTYRGDNRHSGISTEKLSLPLKELWIHKAKHSPRPAWPPPVRGTDFRPRSNSAMTYDRAYHPVVAGAYLYYGSSADDTVYCLDRITGTIQWSFVTEGPVRLAPTISNGKVYAGSDDGLLYCLDAKNGTLLWQHRAGPDGRRLPGNERMISLWPVRCGILVEDGAVYFAAGLFHSYGVYLCALNAKDGTTIWKQMLNWPPVSPQGYLLASASQLFLPSGRAPFRGFDRSDGKYLGRLGRSIPWRGRVIGGCFGVMTEGLIATGPSALGQIHIFDAESRKMILSTSGLRLIGKDDMFYILKQDSLVALSRTRHLELGRKITAIETVDKYERTDEQKKQLAQLRKQHRTRWKWKVPRTSSYSLIMTADTLFAGGDGSVTAYRTSDGTVVWSGACEGKAYGLAVSSGSLFVSTDKGTIHCFTSGTPADRPVARADIPKKTLPYPEDEWTLHYERAAEAALKTVDVRKGYCLVLAAGTGRLAYEIAKRSDFRVIGVEENEENIAVARKKLDQAGLYGTRIVMHHVKGNTLPYQKYCANLIVSDAAVRTGEILISAKEVMRVLRPCGGVAYFGHPAKTASSGRSSYIRRWIKTARTGEWKIIEDNGVWVMTRRGPLPDSGEWTHQYADPGNTSCSNDKRIRKKLEMQWFGRPGPRNMVDRHSKPPAPLFANGRLFIKGDRHLFGVDAYNGTILWDLEVPSLQQRINIPRDCGYMAADDDNFYIALENTCWRLNGNTGNRDFSYELPDGLNKKEYAWGFLACQDETIFGSAVRNKTFFADPNEKNVKFDKLPNKGHYKVGSDSLFALEKNGGRCKWNYRGLIINPTIAIGPESVYFVENRNKTMTNASARRLGTKELWQDLYLVALDVKTGVKKWERSYEFAGGKVVFYLSYADNTLLLVSSTYTHYMLYAFNATTGNFLWKKKSGYRAFMPNHHGGHMQHPVIANGTVYQEPHAFNLKTGVQGSLVLERGGHGCGALSGSSKYLFGRANSPTMYDPNDSGKRTRLTRVTRSGCWINIIPAGGLILVPEASSGCVCELSLQTSFALAPRDDTP